MDADWLDSERDQFLSQREKRWSMNSQRLEEIVAAVMNPVSNVDLQKFDSGFCELLEAYLTEAGIRALDAEDSGVSSSNGSVVVDTPINFAEVALMLQQFAAIYGRKVDSLYDYVKALWSSLHQGTPYQGTISGRVEPETPSANRRKRKSSASAGALVEFVDIDVSPSNSATREVEPPRQPPTLPHVYIELEPRVLTSADVPLFDYEAESIGLITDFQVTWRLHEGLLVDELEGGGAGSSRALRPISLLELQAAIEAAGPSSPPPAPSPHDESPPRDLSPLHASTPLPTPLVEPAPTAQSPVGDTPSPIKRERKRRSEVKIDDIFLGNIKIFQTEFMDKLTQMRDFSISEEWIESVVQKRKARILSERKLLMLENTIPANREFIGWTEADVTEARRSARTLEDSLSGRVVGSRCRDRGSQSPAFGSESAGRSPESHGRGSQSPGRPGATPDTGRKVALRPSSECDDGFFEQSSGPDAEECVLSAEATAWRRAVLRRASAEAARGSLDVRALARRLLRALARAPRAFRDVLRADVPDHTDVSHIFLATLFLATSGNVEICPGPPLTLNSFSVRLVSSELRHYAELPSTS